MAKFKFTTQTAGLTNFRAPSGTIYTINKGIPFTVSIKGDEEFFEKNYRFEKVGMFDSVTKTVIPIVKEKEVEETVMTILESIKGLSDLTKKRISDTYAEIDALEQAVDAGYLLHESVPAKQQELIRKHFHKDLAAIEGLDEETEEKTEVNE